MIPSLSLLGLTVATLGSGQDAAQPEPTTLDEILVIGPRRGGTAHTPEQTLDPRAIDSLGGSSIGDVLDRVRRATGETGVPTIIINGRRVADPSIFMRLPPDALDRLEVLSAGTASEYGGEPSGRTYNLVVAQTFQSLDGRFEAARPTAGGKTRLASELNHNTLDGMRLTSGRLTASRTSALYARSRPHALSDTMLPDSTLQPASDSLGGDLSLNRPFGDWSGGLTLGAERSRSRSVISLTNDTVENRSTVDSVRTSFNLGGAVQDWFISTTVGGHWSWSDQAGLVGAKQTLSAANANFTASRSFEALPAGLIQTNLSLDFSQSRAETSDETGRSLVSSSSQGGRGNLIIPVLGVAEGGRGFHPGAVSLVLGGGWTGGDAGDGRALNGGVNWQPAERIRLMLTAVRATAQPDVQQRQAPLTLGAPMPIYDFRTSSTVQVTPLLGGNPALRAPTTDALIGNVSIGPFPAAWDLQAGLSYSENVSRDGIVTSLAPTPANEAAFPDRFIRDPDGRLVRVDQRPFNLAETRSGTITSNLNLTLPWVDGLRLMASHTWRFRDELRLGPGAPIQDRLSGDGGGAPSQSALVQITYGSELWSGSVDIRRDGGYRLRRDIGLNGPDDLIASAYTSVDMEFSYRLARDLQSAEPNVDARRGEGLRLQLSVRNLMDARGRARFSDGRPSSDYRAPTEDLAGRTIQLALTQRF